MAESFHIIDERKFKETYSRLWKRLYAIAYNCVRDKAAAQELVQELFVTLWNKKDSLSHVIDLDAYLFKSIRHRIYEHFKKVAAQQRLKDHSRKIFTEEIHPVEEAIDYDETLSVINEELDKLPATTRTIFRMSKFERYTNKEIANEMHLSAKAVEYHITQALKKLRIRLSHMPVYTAIMTLLKQDDFLR